MAAIPGISGYVQPGVFVRDRVISRGVSIPGGQRVPCIMGEGLREETIVDSAVGDGRDGFSQCSPNGSPSGRFFGLSNAPVIRGRTELYLNGSMLRGVESKIDDTSFEGMFDFRIDVDTGCIELQKASISDQGGRKFSASSLNVGDGFLVDGTCGTFDLISVLDQNAPAERWTIRAVGVIRDTNGNPIPGLTTFTATGSVSGLLRTSNGQPILFRDSYVTGTQGAVSGNQVACDDGFVVASSDDFGLGDAVVLPGDGTPMTTRTFEVSGNLLSPGQVLPGDELCIDGYLGVQISEISYNSGTDITRITLETDSLNSSVSGATWEIKATNIFIDDPSVLHDLDGQPATAGSFNSSFVGKVLMICSGSSSGLYRIVKVTSSRRLRVVSLDNAAASFPSMSDDDSDGLSETGLQFHIMETNGVLLFGISPGTVPFSVGDKFFVDVRSRVLKRNDRLEARYIAVSDINDPELFVSAAELQVKHGRESVVNTLSLGARMCFENQAPFILALQCKPPIARRTSSTLVTEVNSRGIGGFRACGGSFLDCEPDDLTFLIPLPTFGLQKARPDIDTQVNIFVVRNGRETQIFPNKVSFYNPQLENPTGQNNFISNPDFAFSYTVVNTDTRITGQGSAGAISAADSTFSTSEVDFDAEDVGRVIVIQSLVTSSNAVLTTSSDISNHLFGDSSVGVELVITDVYSDGSVGVQGNDSLSSAIIENASQIQFFVKELSDTTNVRAALILHRTLVESGTIREGDGIRISYIDEVDSDFFDTNWFEAFEALEAEDCQIVVPLPLQNRGGIFRAAVQHVETMSTIAIQKERVAMFGAQQGLTTDAILGLKEVAVEDIGVLEGIQGDDPEEVLDGNVEDLQDYKLDRNFTSNRSVFFYPDQIVRSINGSNTFIDGFYMAAAAAGWHAATQNVAIPLTKKALSGFSILRDRKFRPTVLNQLGAVGATVVQPIVGGGEVLAGRTTSQSGFVEDEEISIIFIRDAVKDALRRGMSPFIGTVEDQNTQGVLTSRVVGIMSGLVSRGLISGYDSIRVNRDKFDPRQWNVLLRFQPNYPINYVFVDIEVGVL